MQTWIALFRGINVGGKNLLPMAALVEGLKSLKLKNVRTYIQSGNALFESSTKSSDSIRKKLAKSIESSFGFKPHVFVLTDVELKRVVAENPFSGPDLDPKTVHFYFLDRAPMAGCEAAIESTMSATEKFAIVGRMFYLYAPDGIGRSKLAAKAEKLLGVTTTARNLRTVQKLLEMSNKR